MTKHSSRLLGVLGAAVVLSSVAANSLSSSGCWDALYGDGYCTPPNNNAECGYDGGDCCECTCQNPQGGDHHWICSKNGSGFACVDPDAPCYAEDGVTVEASQECDFWDLGDGWCDQVNNNELCGYDGGDCCECTCEVPTDDDWDNDLYVACGEGFACIDPSAPCVNDDDITVDVDESCDAVGMGDGYCDMDNNNAACAYDGGDCCECTCEPNNKCGGRSGFACIDPGAPCVDDDSVTVDMIDNCDYLRVMGNGWCDEENNNELCAYDGGDCCECTCESAWNDDYTCSSEHGTFNCKDPNASCFGEETTGSDDFSTDDQPMSYEFVPWEETEALPTVDGAVEVGTKTEVGVSSTAHDVRPGDDGCGEVGGLGCTAANTRDGIFSEIESRWSCATKLVDDEGPCQIEFTFAEPQTIVDIQVAFWKGNERTRTLEVYINGEMTHTHESYADATFNTLGVTATDVSTVMLESVALLSDEWISLIEVLIFVTP
ncbi:conserved unknown protein [Ectocarpus siliculosus]|uniref:LNR domain-containing protein n=1 Tax=Ectocarpus siliculosus TaxID=2880 RepID=D7G4F9_ECTSI|nr:conserved unknown protein [Ectocarpus siliculosus]|eukprot:CBJ33705.1 conserved unknown protein [Ectocarpus siliculosus]